MIENVRARGSKASLPAYTVILMIPVVIGVAARFVFPDSFNYSIWSDRDLLRASQIWEFFPVEGAEINGAHYARVPGGFYYYILALIQMLAEQPVAIYVLLSSAVVGGFYAVYRTGRVIFGVAGAIASTGAYALSPGVLASAQQIWNPILTLPMTACIYLLLVMVLRGRAWALPVLIALLMITIQVHLSNLALLVGVGVVLVVVPHEAKAKHWALSLFAVFAIFAPYIAVELGNGFVNTKLILAGHDEGKLYSAPSFRDLFNSLAVISGGGPLHSNDPVSRVFTGLAFALMVLVVVRVGMAVQRCGFGLRPLQWRRQLANVTESERLIVSLAIIVVICGVLLAINRNATIDIRYILFLIPAIALLVGAVMAEVLDRLQAKTGPVILAAGCFAAFYSFHGYTYAAGKAHGTSSTAGLSALIDGLKSQAGFDDNDLRSKVLLLGAEGSVQFRQAGYMIRINSSQVSSQKYKGCALAVNAFTKHEALARTATVFSAQQIAAPPLEYLFQTGDMHVFGYELVNANCYTSLINPYDWSPLEREIHDTCKAAQADGLILTKDIAGPTHKIFVLRHTFAHSRLCLGLDMQLRSGNVMITKVLSMHLKGYTGYTISGYQLAEAKLIFKKSGGDTHEFDLIDGPLGGHGNILMTPWRKQGRLPNSGDYRLIFAGKIVPLNDTHDVDETINLVLSKKMTFGN